MTGVRTDHGDVECEVVVNCAGQWAKALGDLAGVTVPLHSAEHFYVVTEAVAGTHPDLPIMRDPDGWTYFKEEVGGLVVGGFEPEAKPWVAPDQIPTRSSSRCSTRTGSTSGPDGRGRRRVPGPRATGSGSSTTGPRASRPTTSS